jgi:glutamine cyclotransferase
LNIVNLGEVEVSPREAIAFVKRHGVVIALIVLVFSGVASLNGNRFEFAPQGGAPVYGYRVVNSYPHDPDAYTQGLIYRDGFLFESTGLYGRSSLRKVKLETGQVVQHHPVVPMYFAEGLTDWRARLIQLTWQSNIGFVYDLASFAPQQTFPYSGEGWGLTHDQSALILSDGTANLRFLNPDTFRETRRLAVRDGNTSIKDLNELEYIRGEIYANVWHSDRIARISPASGQVTGWIDLRGILPPVYKLAPEAVLNGIAYDATRNRLFVTGKLWPRLFEIEVGPRK